MHLTSAPSLQPPPPSSGFCGYEWTQAHTHIDKIVTLKAEELAQWLGALAVLLQKGLGLVSNTYMVIHSQP